MEHQLICFEDGIKYVCTRNEVRQKKNITEAKWLNKKWYRAKIIAKGEKNRLYELLELFENDKIQIQDTKSEVRFWVEYEDQVQQICSSDEILQNEKRVKARWLDQKWYPARILMESEKVYVEAIYEKTNAALEDVSKQTIEKSCLESYDVACCPITEETDSTMNTMNKIIEKPILDIPITTSSTVEKNTFREDDTTIDDIDCPAVENEIDMTIEHATIKNKKDNLVHDSINKVEETLFIESISADESDLILEDDEYSSSSWHESSDGKESAKPPQKNFLKDLKKAGRSKVTTSSDSSGEEPEKLSNEKLMESRKRLQRKRLQKPLKKSKTDDESTKNSTKSQKNQDRAISPVIPFINENFEDAFENQIRPDNACNSKSKQSTTFSPITNNAFSDEEPYDTLNDDGSQNMYYDDEQISKTTDVNLYKIRVNIKKSGESKNKKSQYCKFCLQPQKKLSRHLIKIHKEEDEVDQLLKYANPRDPCRQQLLTKLRNDGAFIHNRRVLTEGVGELHTKRRLREGALEKEEIATNQYLPCPKCRVSVQASYLYRHAKNCQQQSNVSTSIDTNAKKTQHGIRAQAALLLPTHHKVSENFKNHVLVKMNPDKIFRVVRSDNLILEYGSYFYQKLGTKGLQAQYIIQKMREMARFLQSMRSLEHNPYLSLEACIKPRFIEKIIQATKTVAGYNSKTMRFEKPSLALKIGHGVNRCCTILKGKACQREDELKNKQLQQFEQTMIANWGMQISSLALRSAKDRKVNRVETIPLTEDIRKFNIYVQNNMIESLRHIKDIPTSDALTMLSRCTLALLVSFNRRRAGEVSKIRTDQAKLLEPGDPHPDVMEHLNSFELHLTSKLSRFEIIGKRGRTVPVLLTPLLNEAVSVLLHPRNRAILGILEENPFLFAIPQSKDTYRRACDEIRTFSTKCGATFPQHLRSTLLRIQFASIRQLDNIANNELDIIADFMGHDIRVHRHFYRLPQSTLQIAKMGKCITDANLGINLDINLDTLEVDDLNKVQLDDYVEFSDYEDSESDDPVDSADEGSKIACVVTKTTKPSTTKRSNANLKNCSTKNQIRRKWSDEENGIINEYFSTHIAQKIIPPKSLNDQMLNLLPGRTYRNVKDKVRNSFLKN